MGEKERQADESLPSVIPQGLARHIGRSCSERLWLRVPANWRSSVYTNPYAKQAEQQILEWFKGLGCTPAELERASKFDVAGYVGIPFPHISNDITIRLGKYLSLWLLWDDVHVESLENRWRIDPLHIFENRRPPDMTRFDQGWWELFQEFAERRSKQWVIRLCEAMATWNTAAVREAVLFENKRKYGTLPTFKAQLETRISTIGMYATVYLLEDEYDFELPNEFHNHPTVKQLKKLANEIVGLGNDIFSFGKDLAEDQLNLISTLMHEGRLSVFDALTEVIEMHNRALVTFDELADSIGSWGAEANLFVNRWLQDVRYASLGFSLWESQAPRYNVHKLVVNGLVVEPSFVDA